MLDQPITLVYEHCLRALIHADARPRTLEAYQDTLRLWARWSGDRPIDQITTVMLAN